MALTGLCRGKEKKRIQPNLSDGVLVNEFIPNENSLVWKKGFSDIIEFLLYSTNHIL